MDTQFSGFMSQLEGQGWTVDHFSRPFPIQMEGKTPEGRDFRFRMRGDRAEFTIVTSWSTPELKDRELCTSITGFYDATYGSETDVSLLDERQTAEVFWFLVEAAKLRDRMKADLLTLVQPKALLEAV